MFNAIKWTQLGLGGVISGVANAQWHSVGLQVVVKFRVVVVVAQGWLGAQMGESCTHHQMEGWTFADSQRVKSISGR
jgi:hypothetical protein